MKVVSSKTICDVTFEMANNKKEGWCCDCTVLCNAQSGQNPLKPLIKCGLRRHQFEAHLIQVYNSLKPLDVAAFDHWLVEKSNEFAVFLFLPEEALFFHHRETATL